MGVLGGPLANPQAYGPLGSTHSDPSNKGWALWAAARAATFPSRAGCDRTDGTREVPPPPGVVPQAAGRKRMLSRIFGNHAFCGDGVNFYKLRMLS